MSPLFVIVGFRIEATRPLSVSASRVWCFQCFLILSFGQAGTGWGECQKKWLGVKLYNHGQWFYIIPHPFLGVSSVYWMMFAHWGNCRLRRVQSERPAITIIWAHNPSPPLQMIGFPIQTWKCLLSSCKYPLIFAWSGWSQSSPIRMIKKIGRVSEIRTPGKNCLLATTAYQ